MPSRQNLRDVLPAVPLWPKGAREPVFADAPAKLARALGDFSLQYLTMVWSGAHPYPVTLRLARRLAALTRGAWSLEAFLGLNPADYPAKKRRWPGGREYARRRHRKRLKRRKRP